MDGSSEQESTYRIKNQIPWAIQKDVNEDYVLGDEIGSGEYGKIFECEKGDSKSKRAVKIIQKKLIDNPEQYGNELKQLKLLNHPNIIKIYDVYETEEKIAIVQEICMGDELLRYIAYKNIQHENESAKIMRQAFQAVLYLHERNIIHGDIKLENFLLKHDKDDSSIKLIDFGLHKHLNDNAIIKKLDKIKETPFYQAPEVSKGQLQKASDMWSLGVLLYILISGRSPFRGKNGIEIYNSIQKGIFTFNIEPFKHASVEVKDLISKLLIAQPKRRYTAFQSYNHPWIQFNVCTESQEKQIHEQVFQGLSDLIASKNSQKRAMLMWMVNQIPEKKKKALKKIYNKIDEDGSGSVTEEELVDGMRKYGPNAGVSMSDDQVRKIFRQMDYDGGGSVDFTEFLAAFVDNQSSRSEEFLREQFKKMDKDGSGSVGREELMELLKILPLGDVDIEELVNECDKDGDGEINFEEFMGLLREKL